MILVVVMATPQVVAYLRAIATRGPATTAPVAVPASPAGAAPARTAGPHVHPAHDAVPDSFRRHPLAFLSRAPADSLCLLPAIGPVLATRIDAARRGRGPFTTWDDVRDVRGIGPRTIEKLKALTGEH
jgi:predicted flap endonuclease-1-like 5' DNA nuclease